MLYNKYYNSISIDNYKQELLLWFILVLYVYVTSFSTLVYL